MHSDSVSRGNNRADWSRSEYDTLINPGTRMGTWPHWDYYCFGSMCRSFRSCIRAPKRPVQMIQIRENVSVWSICTAIWYAQRCAMLTLPLSPYRACSTRIKYMTDGVLLREAMGDPLLSAYAAIVLDEVGWWAKLHRSRRLETAPCLLLWPQANVFLPCMLLSISGAMGWPFIRFFFDRGTISTFRPRSYCTVEYCTVPNVVNVYLVPFFSSCAWRMGLGTRSFLYNRSRFFGWGRKLSPQMNNGWARLPQKKIGAPLRSRCT